MITEQQIQMMDEENKRFWRGVIEREKSACENKLGTSLGQNLCKECENYKTPKCFHPEKAVLL